MLIPWDAIIKIQTVGNSNNTVSSKITKRRKRKNHKWKGNLDTEI